MIIFPICTRNLSETITIYYHLSHVRHKSKIHMISTRMHCDTFCNASLPRDVCVETITTSVHSNLNFHSIIQNDEFITHGENVHKLRPQNFANFPLETHENAFLLSNSTACFFVKKKFPHKFPSLECFIDHRQLHDTLFIIWRNSVPHWIFHNEKSSLTISSGFSRSAIKREPLLSRLTQIEDTCALVHPVQHPGGTKRAKNGTFERKK